MKIPQFAILLPTFNGEKFLEAQLDSIFSQTLQDFILVVRDDGSSDRSMAILEQYAARYPGQMHICQDKEINLGASRSFSRLMDYVLEHKLQLGLNKAYMAFSDQDDLWRENKLELQWQAMQDCESANPGLPVLIHSDLAVVQENGEKLADSLAAYQGLETARNRFHHMVLSNLVTGCTALINEELARLALPIGKSAMMHDWWLALGASAFGKLCYLPESLVSYRQHGANVVGAKEKRPDGLRNASFWKRAVEPGPNPHLFEVSRQAAEFRRVFGERLTFSQRMSLRAASLMRVRIGLVQRLIFKFLRQF